MIAQRLKLFDFTNWCRTYNKSYPTLDELVSRSRVYLANALKVFIAWVKYIKKELTSFERTNSMSDWTEQELAKLTTFGSNRKLHQEMLNLPQEGLDIEDIEEQFRDVVNQKERDGKLAEIVRELESPDRVGPGGLSLDDLAARPPEVDPRALESEQIPASNNPNYEPPELISQGAEDEGQVEAPLGPMQWRFPSVNVGRVLKTIATRSGLEIGPPSQEENENEDEDEDGEEEDGETELLPDEVFVDHRTSDCMTAPREQLKCGSCYIFSTIALLEYEHCRQTGERVLFSEQFAIDCGHRAHLKGCDGGEERDVIQFTREYGLELLSNYPYAAKEQSCPYDDSVSSQVMGYLKVPDLNYNTVDLNKLEYHLKRTPVLVGVYVTKSFSRYGGKIDFNLNCNREAGHAMLLVGHGREDGHEYWLFKNSYGEDWGEKGYWKLNKATGTECIMDGVGWIVRRVKNRVTAVNEDYVPIEPASPQLNQ